MRPKVDRSEGRDTDCEDIVSFHQPCHRSPHRCQCWLRSTGRNDLTVHENSTRCTRSDDDLGASEFDSDMHRALGHCVTVTYGRL